MKVTTRQEKTNGTARLAEALAKFETNFKKEEPDQDYYHILIVGEYNRAVCDEIQKIYTEAGWFKVNCRTSTENGERGGLTGLILHANQ